MKRLFDIFFALLGVILLLPVFIVISLIILFTSKGGIFFIQKRIGKNLKPFNIIKFRTMYKNRENTESSHITGYKDTRITKIGRFLRKHKFDELPQLINILIGKMSFVGPRPESYKYLSAFNEEAKKIFSVKPGLTDFSSIVFSNEEKMFQGKNNIEEYYIKTLLPRKINLCLKYINEQSILIDIKIIMKTIKKIFNHR